MKKLIFLVIAGCMASFASGQTKHLKDEKVFEVKSGVVEYLVDGMSKGTKTLWFDDYGRLQCTLTKIKTKMMGISNTEEKLEIRSHEWMYTIDLKEKTGTKTRIETAMKPADDMVSDLTPEERKQFEESVKQSLNAREVGKEEVLGRSCIIIEIGQGNKVWGYKNLTLKTVVGLGMLKLTETATNFDENASVPASKFEVPAGIEMRDVTEMMRSIPFMGDDNDDE